MNNKINQVEIENSIYDIDAKTLNGRTITADSNSPTDDMGNDGDIWFVLGEEDSSIGIEDVEGLQAALDELAASAGISLVPMDVVNGAVTISEPGIYMSILGYCQSVSFIYIEDLSATANGTYVSVRYYTGSSYSTAEHMTTYNYNTKKITTNSANTEGIAKCYKFIDL